MATVKLKPSSAISGGSFKDESNTAGINVAKINDSNHTSTYLYNSSANQNMTLALDDTSGLSGATFNNFVVTAVFQKHGGRGADASFEVDIGDSSSSTAFGSVSDLIFVTTNSSATTINASAINFGGSVSASDVDDMRLSVTTTDGTQVRFFELVVQIDYTAAAAGYTHDVNSVAAASIGKVNSVATASIGKINSVD
jgi:hypothetical protein